MKKIIILVLAVGLLTTMVAPSYALLRTDHGAQRGKLVAVNTATGEITIQNTANGLNSTFKVKGSLPSSANIGKVVTVIYNRKTGMATNVSVRGPKGAAAAPAAAPSRY